MCTLQILTYVILHQVKVLVLLSLQMAHHAHSSQKRPRALRTIQVNPCQKCVHCTLYNSYAHSVYRKPSEVVSIPYRLAPDVA